MKTRSSNFELLRLVAMFMIVAFHIISVYQQNNRPHVSQLVGQNVEIMAIFKLMYASFGNGGVTLFAMISGYFLINATTRSLERAGQNTLKFIGMILFNGVIVGTATLAVYLLLQSHGLVPDALASTIDTTKNYLNDYRVTFGFNGGNWYLAAYVILFMIMPYLNKQLQRLDLKSYFFVIVLVIIATGIFSFEQFISVTNAKGFPTVFVGYLIGDFFRRFEPLANVKVRYLWIGIMIFIGYFVFEYEFMVRKAATDIFRATPATGNNYGWLAYVVPILLFEMFRRLEFSNRFINLIAPTTLFIYIYHLALPVDLFYAVRDWLLGPIAARFIGLPKFQFDLVLLGIVVLYTVTLMIGGIVLGLIYNQVAQASMSAFKKINILN